MLQVLNLLSSVRADVIQLTQSNIDQVFSKYTSLLCWESMYIYIQQLSPPTCYDMHLVVLLVLMS